MLLPSLLRAQTAPEWQASLVGLVLADDSLQRPLRGAIVELRGLGRRVRTDSSGAYVVPDVPPGVHSVNVQALGFRPVVVEVLFARAEQVQRDFLLAEHAGVELPALEVRATSPPNEFEERRRLRNGRFITRAELEKVLHKKLGEILAPVPGLRIQRYGSAAAAANRRGAITMLGSNPSCFVQVYLNGAPVSNSAAVDIGTGQRARSGSIPVGVFDLNSIPTAEIDGIEYYAGGASVPTKFNRTGSACGVLLIWTRGWGGGPGGRPQG